MSAHQCADHKKRIRDCVAAGDLPLPTDLLAHITECFDCHLVLLEAIGDNLGSEALPLQPLPLALRAKLAEGGHVPFESLARSVYESAFQLSEPDQCHIDSCEACRRLREGYQDGSVYPLFLAKSQLSPADSEAPPDAAEQHPASLRAVAMLASADAQPESGFRVIEGPAYVARLVQQGADLVVSVQRRTTASTTALVSLEDISHELKWTPRDGLEKWRSCLFEGVQLADLLNSPRIDLSRPESE